ncbi:MAG: PorV/PorQ family protein [bacterium]|jgi:hypothetical protein
MEIKKLKFTLLIIFTSLLALNASAQTAKYSNEFLSLGVGARAFGMSNSVVASTNDVYAGYWNPAGLTQMNTQYQGSLMHSEYFGSIAKYDFGAIAYKVDDRSNIAFSIIRFGVDDIPNTTELIDAGGNINYDRISSFSAVDYAFIGSYARKMNDPRMSVGANVKVVHRKIGDFAKSFGFGIDFGMQYQLERFKFGIMARDISTTFNAWSYNIDENTKKVFENTGNEIPENGLEVTVPKFILGAAYVAKISSKFKVNTELNFDLNTDGQRNVLISSKYLNIDPHAGIEVDYRNIAFLRAGIGNIQRQRDFDGTESTMMMPNMGIGVKIKNIHIDYALTDIGNSSESLYSNVFSLKIELGKNAN